MLSKFLLTAVMLLTPSILLAKKAPIEELEARFGETVVRISSAKCTNKKVLDQIKPEYHARFLKAEVRNSVKSAKGCWTPDPNGLFIILEDGDQGYMPPDAFKPVETL